jgi:hypothetical protein
VRAPRIVKCEGIDARRAVAAAFEVSRASMNDSRQ